MATTTKKKTAPKKKMGRPKSELPKGQVQCFRITQDESILLEWMAKAQGMTESQLVRGLVGTGVIANYSIFKKANKTEFDVYTKLLKRLIKTWAIDPTATMPKSMVTEFLESEEIPTDLKKGLLDFFE